MFTDAAFKRLTLALNSIVGQTAMGVFFFFFFDGCYCFGLTPRLLADIVEIRISYDTLHCTVVTELWCREIINNNMLTLTLTVYETNLILLNTNHIDFVRYTCGSLERLCVCSDDMFVSIV